MHNLVLEILWNASGLRSAKFQHRESKLFRSRGAPYQLTASGPRDGLGCLANRVHWFEQSAKIQATVREVYCTWAFLSMLCLLLKNPLTAVIFSYGQSGSKPPLIYDDFKDVPFCKLYQEKTGFKKVQFTLVFFQYLMNNIYAYLRIWKKSKYIPVPNTTS